MKLDSPEGELKHLYSGNQDLACMLVNFIKVNAVTKGQPGGGLEFFKADPINQKLFGYLSKVSQPLLQEFFEERKQAETMFDEALAKLKWLNLNIENNHIH